MLRLNCFFQASESRYDEALQAACPTAKSLSHEGCRTYDVFESTTRPDIFMICETWRNQAALDRLFGEGYMHELHRLVIHSILHLCGIDDKTPQQRAVMEDAENRALEMYAGK